MIYIFENPKYLWLLFISLSFFIIFLNNQNQKKQRLSTLGEPKLLSKYIIQNGAWKQKIAIFLFMLGFSLLVIALANPRWGQKAEKTTVKQADLLLILDISNSMLAQDIPPNRLQQAKFFFKNLIEKSKTDRVALVAFAAEAHLIMPFSEDKAAAKMYIQSLDNQTITAQGSDFRGVVDVLTNLKKSNNNRPMAVVLATDGEFHESLNLPDLQLLSKENITFTVVGIGTADGSFVPDDNGFKKDEDGIAIKTFLNEKSLSEIAANGSGKFFYLADNQDFILEEIIKNIEKIADSGASWQQYENAESRFQIFLGLGLVCFFVFYFFKMHKLK